MTQQATLDSLVEDLNLNQLESALLDALGAGRRPSRRLQAGPISAHRERPRRLVAGRFHAERARRPEADDPLNPRSALGRPRLGGA
jgi:hypothetical protein